MSYAAGPALALFATPAPGRAAEELAAALAGPGLWIGLRIGGELSKANPDTGEPLPLLPCPFGAVLLAHGPAGRDRAGDPRIARSGGRRGRPRSLRAAGRHRACGSARRGRAAGGDADPPQAELHRGRLSPALARRARAVRPAHRRGGLSATPCRCRRPAPPTTRRPVSTAPAWSSSATSTTPAPLAPRPK